MDRTVALVSQESLDLLDNPVARVIPAPKETWVLLELQGPQVSQDHRDHLVNPELLEHLERKVKRVVMACRDLAEKRVKEVHQEPQAIEVFPDLPVHQETGVQLALRVPLDHQEIREKWVLPVCRVSPDQREIRDFRARTVSED